MESDRQQQSVAPLQEIVFSPCKEDCALCPVRTFLSNARDSTSVKIVHLRTVLLERVQGIFRPGQRDDFHPLHRRKKLQTVEENILGCHQQEMNGHRAELLADIAEEYGELEIQMKPR